MTENKNNKYNAKKNQIFLNLLGIISQFILLPDIICTNVNNKDNNYVLLKNRAYVSIPTST